MSRTAQEPGQRTSSRRGALTLMGGTLASRVTGLVRNSLLAQFFPTVVIDAFVTAFKVPNLFRELLAEGALSNSFVPIYKRLAVDDARRLAGALLAMLVIVNGLLMGLAYLAAPSIARLLIADAGHVDVDLTVRLIRIVFPFLPAISFSALAMGILNAEERFLAPAWAPVALNVVTVTLMALFPGQALMLALAHVLGGVAQLVVQVPALIRSRLLPRLGALWHPALASVAMLMLPFAFTASGRQVLNVVASNVITGIDAGAQGAFYLADLFLGLALGLFSISPALAYYSRLSDHAVNEEASFGPTLSEGVRFISFLTVPAGVAMALLAAPAVDVVYNWRSLFGQPMDPALREYTIAATAPLGLAVFPLGVFNLLIRTFYIRGKVRTPVALVLLTLSFQGLLYVLLAPRFGVAGVASATAVGAWVQFAAAVLLVNRSERFAVGAFAWHAARIWVAALLAGGAAFLAVTLLPLPAGWYGSLAALVVAAVALVIVYALCGALLRLPELAALSRRLRGR
ncbi:MAG TPA: murein biosynthesis integral membrane protein MurJ [Trueperaceae bacterium]|nr:murein biosynthesis integral membrane protein MurJ [Trueperaceae bacterium]